MATVATHFASGQIAITKTSIFTSTNTSRISKFVVTNTTQSNETITFYRDDGTELIVGTYKITAAALGQGAAQAINDLQGIILENGDEILAVATTDSVVNFQIDGDLIT